MRGDHRAAIQMYERNTELSEALYGVTQGLEVALRNAIHGIMTTRIGSPAWYDHIGLDEPERKSIDDAKDKILDKPQPVTPGRVVAELTFGFWVKLTAGPYEKLLWVPYLNRIFPIKIRRTTLHGRLVEIKTLRNRIAHHERIVGKRDLPQDYRDTLEAIGWISSPIRAWVEHTNCFEERYAKKLTRPKVKSTAVVAASQPSDSTSGVGQTEAR